MTNPLDNMDVRLIVDVSASMNGEGRFAAAIAAATELATEALKVDDDGIEIGAFGKTARWLGNATTAQEAADLLNACGARDGATMTGDAVKMGAANRAPGKNTICIILTDGAASDGNAAADAIVKISQDLAPSPSNANDTDELTYLFVQVGTDEGAAAWLQMLDDDLEGKGARYDIVDAKSARDIAGKDIYEVIMEAITD